MKKSPDRGAVRITNIDEYCRSVAQLLKNINDNCATKADKKTFEEEPAQIDIDSSLTDF